MKIGKLEVELSTSTKVLLVILILLIIGAIASSFFWKSGEGYEEAKSFNTPDEVSVKDESSLMTQVEVTEGTSDDELIRKLDLTTDFLDGWLSVIVLLIVLGFILGMFVHLGNMFK